MPEIAVIESRYTADTIGLDAAQARAIAGNKRLGDSGSDAALKLGNAFNKLGSSADAFASKAASLGPKIREAFDLHPVNEAFKTLGVTSQASLNKTALEAQRAFNIIKSSGTATPRDIELAHQAMSQKVGAALAGVGGSYNNLQGQAMHATSGISAAMTGLVNIAANLATQVASSLVGLVTSAVSTGFAFNSLKEQSLIAFTTILGSSDAAKAHLSELFSFAARTPFEFQGITLASQKLQAMGFSATEVIPTLTAVGDAVAGVGGSTETLNGVVLALGQMKAKAKVSAEEMNQLAERGIPAWKLLADSIGKSVPEAMKLAEKGALNADQSIKALVDGMEKKFAGMMDAQSRTWSGLMSTLSDNMQQIIGGIVEPLFERAKSLLADFLDKLPEIKGEFALLSSGLQNELGPSLSFIGKESSKLWGDLKTSLSGSNELFTTLGNQGVEALRGIAVAVGAAVIALEQMPKALGPILDTLNAIANVQRFIDPTGLGKLGQSAPQTPPTPAARVDFRNYFPPDSGRPSKELIDNINKAWWHAGAGAAKAFGGGARKGMKEQWGLLSKETKEALEDWVGKQSLAAKLTVKLWNALPEAVQKPLVALSKTFKETNDYILRLQLENVAKQGQVLVTTANLWNQLPVRIRAGILDLKKVIVQDFFIDTTDRLKDFNTNVDREFDHFDKSSEKLRRSAAKTHAEFTVLFGGLRNAGVAGFSDLTSAYEDFYDATARMPKEGVGPIISAADGIIATWEDLGERMQLTTTQMVEGVQHEFLEGLTKAGTIERQAAQERVDRWIETLRKSGEFTKELTKQYGATAVQMIAEIKNALGEGVGSIVVGLSDLKLQSLALLREWSNDVGRLIAAIPGKLGDSARGILNSVNTFAIFADRVLKIFHNLNKSIPASLDDLIKIIGEKFSKAKDVATTELGGIVVATDDLVKKTTSTLDKILDSLGFGSGDKKSGNSSVLDQILDEIGFGSADSEDAGEESGKSFADGFIKKLPAIISGIATFFGTRGQGKIIGVLGGAAAGAQIGTAILPGWGTAIGAAAGAILGLFGAGGPSEKEKREAEEQRALEIQRLKQSLQQGAQELMQAALTTFKSAMEFLEQLPDYTKVPKEAIKAFFNDLNKVMREFVRLAGLFAGDVLDQANKFAESLGPGVELMGNAVGVLDGIRKHMPLGLRAVALFGADLESLIFEIGRIADAVPDRVEKHAKKLAARMAPLADVLSPIVDGLKAMLDLKPLPENALDIFGDSIEKIMLKLGDIATRLDRFAVKEAARFAERAGSAMSLVREGVEALKSVLDIKPVPESAFDVLFENMKQAIGRMVALAADLTEEGIAKASSIADSSLVIFAAIKAAVESLSALRDYKGVAQSAIDDLVNDFTRALDLLRLMLNDALTFEDLAKSFEERINSGAAALARGVTSFAGAVLNAFSLLNAAIGHVGGGINTTVDYSVTVARAAAVAASPQALATAAAGGDVHVSTVQFNVSARDIDDIKKVRAALSGLQTALRRKN